MRKFSLFIFSICLITLFSTTVYANKPADSEDPSEQDICAPLKEDGVTKGLYGLCIAYQASGNQSVLDNYNKKKGPSDPQMPGTGDEPTILLSCACWNTLTIDEIGADQENVPPSACFLGPSFDLISYENLDNPEATVSEILAATYGYCSYYNSSTQVSVENGSLTPEQEAECRLEILDLAVRDFGDFENCLDTE